MCSTFFISHPRSGPKAAASYGENHIWEVQMFQRCCSLANSYSFTDNIVVIDFSLRAQAPGILLEHCERDASESQRDLENPMEN